MTLRLSFRLHAGAGQPTYSRSLVAVSGIRRATNSHTIFGPVTQLPSTCGFLTRKYYTSMYR